MPDTIPALLFPVEKPVRELDSKLILATAVAARGLRAIVGHLDALHFMAGRSQSVVWLGKNVIADRLAYSSDRHIADQLIRNGSAIMFLHDEGGMYQARSWREQLIHKHQLEALRKRHIDRICVWGERQRATVSDYASDLADKTTVSGSPRFDICSPGHSWMYKDIVASLREVHGNYILVCTRFGALANKKGIHHSFDLKLDAQSWSADLDAGRITDIWFQKWRQDAHDFADFIVLIKELCHTFPGYRIIIRPHPNESPLFYDRAFSGLPNAYVTNAGNVLNWIRGSKLVVHSNCTTGIEAVLAGRPVLNFLPGDAGRSELDVEVAREAGATTRTLAEAIETAEALLKGFQPPHSWSIHARSILHNLEHEAIPLIVDETLAVITERGIMNSRIALPPKSGIWSLRNRLRGDRPPKPGHFNRDHIERIVEGSQEHGIGSACISRFTPRYVVLDPR